jgi:hypothetical protein
VTIPKVHEIVLPTECPNCGSDRFVWGVAAITNLTSNHARPIVILACEMCSETLKGIEDEAAIIAMIVTAMGNPARALNAAWHAIVPNMGPRTLADMGEDHEPNLEALRAILDTMTPDQLLSLGVVASELSAEVHRVRHAKVIRAFRQPEDS